MRSFRMPYSVLIAFLFIMLYYKFKKLESIYYFCEIDYIFKTEQWKDVPGFEGLYHISDLGRVKRLINEKGKIMCSHENKGYLKIKFRRKSNNKSFSVHQLVSIAFLDHKICGHKLVVNHKNFIRNDNRKINLEITTQRENSNKKHLKSTSKYVGVFWSTQKRKWIAQIEINKKKICLGFFTEEKEASEYYNNAVISHENGLEVIKKKHQYMSKYKGVSWDSANNKWRA